MSHYVTLKYMDTWFKNIKLSVAGLIGLFIIIFTIVNWPVVIIHAGERGVVFNWGAFTGQILDPGIHFRIPIMQRVSAIDVKTQKLEITKSEAYSKDLQLVDIHSVLNYYVDPKAVGDIYQQYGLDYQSKILAPNLEAAVKQTVAKYTAEELLNKRSEVQSNIQDAFKSLVPTSFIITGYALVNEGFSPAYENAIEAKQVAQQQAEKATNDLKRVQIEAEQRVTQAKAEAEAIKIQAQAITQQGGDNYVQLKAIEKWDGKLPSQMIPGGTLPFLNLGIK